MKVDYSHEVRHHESRLVRGLFLGAGLAFVAVGVLGNAARTTLFGPGRWNADVALTKRATPLQFRIEVFNVFNNAQFAAPNTVVGSPTFGRITSTVKSSRQIQLAVKYLF